MAKNKSTYLTRTLKVIYAAQKGASLHFEVLIQTVSKSLLEQLQIAKSDSGLNAVSITLIEGTVLLWHVNFRSYDTFDLIILLAFFLSIVKFKRLYHSFILSNTVLKLLSKYLNTFQ